MSVEQLESAILALSAEERRRLVVWLDEHRGDLFAPDSSTDSDVPDHQKAELSRRRQEYRDHPELFLKMDDQSLEEMFSRIRNACARISPAG